jgi:hypothetical protein
MRIDPIKRTAIKFLAPVCRDCSIPMVTVTSIFRHATPDEEKIVAYECQKCGCTLGPARDRRGRQYFVSPLSGFTHPGVTPRHQHHPLIGRADPGFWK